MTEGTLHVSFAITNTGDVTADEVAQLYTRAVDPALPARAANSWPTGV